MITDKDLKEMRQEYEEAHLLPHIKCDVARCLDEIERLRAALVRIISTLPCAELGDNGLEWVCPECGAGDDDCKEDCLLQQCHDIAEKALKC